METKITYGQARSLERGAAESRIIPFILSTPTRDRHNTVLNQENWLLDNYRKNPIVAYQHELTGGIFFPSSPDFVIAKGIRTAIEKIAGVPCLTDAAQFEDGKDNPLAEKVFRKVLMGSMPACSVGFRPVGEGQFGTGAEARGERNETYYFAGQELLEWSIVHIPSNPDAGKRYNRSMRLADPEALNYASHKLRMTRSQIEKYSVSDVLTLLDAADLGIRGKDPKQVLAELRAAIPEYKEPAPQFDKHDTEIRMKNFLISRNMKKESFGLIEAIKSMSSDNTRDRRDFNQLTELALADAGIIPEKWLNDKTLMFPLHSRATLEGNSLAAQEPVFPGATVENRMAIVTAGAKFLTGLKANVTVPNLSGLVADFSDVFDSSTEAVSMASIPLTPKRQSLYLTVSDNVLKFGGQAAEKYVYDSIFAAVASGLERNILSAYASSDYRPQGLGYACTTGTDTAVAAASPTMAALGTLEDAVYAGGLKVGAYSYITNTIGMRKLIAMAESDFSEAMIAMTGRAQSGMELPNRSTDGYLSGHPLYLTNNAAVDLGTGGNGNGLYFGNWSRLMIGQFGPLVVVVDPFSLAKYGKIVIYVHGWFDWKGLDGTVSTGEGTQASDFANFAALPIS